MLKIKLKQSVTGWMGAFMGLGVTGGWLLCDLMLPEPWGDVLLFSLMAVVNVAFGWMFAVMSKQKELSTSEAQMVSSRKLAISTASSIDPNHTIKNKSEG